MDYTDGSVDDGEMVRKMSTLKGEKNTDHCNKLKIQYDTRKFENPHSI